MMTAAGTTSHMCANCILFFTYLRGWINLAQLIMIFISKMLPLVVTDHFLVYGTRAMKNDFGGLVI
jgi:hypothetical protein